MSEGNRNPELFDSDDEMSEYIAQLARDSDELSRDPSFLSWLETLDAEGREQ